MSDIDEEENEMEMPENDGERFISFTKRRSNIYKNASELSILCGVDIGILIFSPAGRAFTFGSPNFESIVNRLLKRENQPCDPKEKAEAEIAEAQRRVDLEEACQKYDDLAAQLYKLKKEGERLERAKEAVQKGCWWEAPLEELSAKELQDLANLMELLLKRGKQKIEEFSAGNSSSA